MPSSALFATDLTTDIPNLSSLSQSNASQSNASQSEPSYRSEWSDKVDGLQVDGLQVVIGLGASGLSAVKFLLAQGHQVAVTDAGYPPLATQLSEAVSIRQFGKIDGELLLKASRIIISPGVNPSITAIQDAKQAGIPIVNDIQLFCDALSHRTTTDGKPISIIAITGSNAKSTVTTLVGQMATDAGVQVGVGGNIGTPALELLADPKLEMAVLELSSFQLEAVSHLNAHVATVLNMSPDHLDRHGDMLSYHQAKHRIFQGAKSVVINRDDALTYPVADDLVADDLTLDELRKISVGNHAPDKGQYGLMTDGDGQTFLAKGNDRLMNVNDLPIKGRHNHINALSALALGELAGLPMDSMLTTLSAFNGLPHRCQFVAQVAGVDYYNDSKGTNIGSTMAAIKGLGESYAQRHTHTSPQESKMMLILGGQGKGQAFGDMVDLVNQYVSHLLFIGEDAPIIEEQLKQAGLASNVICQHSQTLATAVNDAKFAGQNSTTNITAVLLSPACASFDQFKGFVDRGEQFVTLVQALLES